MANTETLMVRIVADTKNFSSALSKMSEDLERVGKDFEGLKNLGKGMQDVGKKLTLGLTVPIVGMAAASVKTSIDIESAFAGVRKTLDVTGMSAKEAEKTYKGIEDGIMAMSKKMPTAATEIASVAESAGQLGIKTKNVLGFTEVMVMLGDTTSMSADEAATSLARLANITGMPQTNFDRLGATIVALGNNLATTEGEITEMGLRLAGAGSQVGMTEAQILSFAGALSSVGIEAQAGGSAFSKVMISMQLATETGSAKLTEYAQVAGMTASEFKTAFQKDAAGAIVAFVKGLANAEKQGKTAIGILDDMGIKEVILRDTLLRAAGASDIFSGALELGTQAWDDNVALTDEANIRYQTTESKIQMAKNAIIAMGKSIGDILLPVVTSICEWITKLADRFTALSPTTQKFIMVIAGVIAVIGPLLSLVGTLIVVFANLSTLAGALGVGIGAIVTPVAVVIGVIAGLIAIGILLCQNWDSIKKWCSDLGKTISTTFSNIGTWISKTWQDVMKWTTETWTNISSYLSTAWQTLCNIVQTGIMLIGSIISAYVTIITLPFQFIWQNCNETIIKYWNLMKQGISNAISFIGEIIGSKFSIIKTNISNTWNIVSTETSRLWNGIKTIIQTIAEFIYVIVSAKFNSIKATITNITNLIKGVVSIGWNGIKSVVSTVSEGISSVVSSKFNSVKNNISNSINSAKSIVSSGLSAISGFFSRCKLQLPKFKLPHFSVDGKLSINPPSVPKLKVDWYSKGGIFTKPSVLGGIGVGDKHNGIGSGAEAVLPLDKLPGLLGLDNNDNGGSITLNIENFNNNREQDIKQLLRELEFYRKRANKSVGGAY